MIRRLEAQRACLAAATERVQALPGVFLELGLGNGRTYDHLRELAPQREIFVFERNPAAHPACTPPGEFLVEGDLTETLARKKAQLEGSAVLAHCDIGSGVRGRDVELASAISSDLDALLCNGAIVLSDQDFDRANWRPLSTPKSVEPRRYFMYLKV